MGVNIIIERLDGHTRHPTWDTVRAAGDRDILRMVADDTLPSSNRLNDVGGGDVWQGAEPVYRPADFAVWRRILAERFDYNHERWTKLVDILEADADWWLYFSV